MRMATGLVQPAGCSVWCLVWMVIVVEVVAARGRMFCVGVSDVEPWGRLTSRCETALKTKRGEVLSVWGWVLQSALAQITSVPG